MKRLTIAARTKLAALDGASGKDWYANARRLIAAEASRLDVDPSEFADILALTSPRVSVSKNWEMAQRYCRSQGKNTKGFMRSTRVALEHWEATRIIRGPKTSAFSAALKGNEDYVVLDTWMAAFFRVDQRLFDRPKVRAKYEKVVRGVALDLGWTPAQVQAAVWQHAVREVRRNPGAYPSQIPLFD